MSTPQTPYNQPPMQGMMPTPPPPMHGPMPPHGGMPPLPPLPPMQAPRHAPNWRERLLGGGNARPLTLMQERTVPNWLIGKSVAFFFIAFVACTIVWGHPMEMRYAIVSSLSVLLFFYGSRSGSQSWASTGEKTFIKNVFILGLCARLLWVFYCYFFFNPDYYGNTYGNTADVDWYMPFGEDIAEWLRGNSLLTFAQVMERWDSAIDDVGYPIWLAIINILTLGESHVFVPLFIKAIVSTYCAVCVFRIAKRHFGEGSARLAALFVALNPNMIYWCGNMFKESEMVFLCCLCVDLVDRTFTSGKKLSFLGLLPGILAGMAVFFFRAPLAIVLFLAMFAHIVMASGKVMSLGKKIIAGVMVGVVLLVGMGDRLQTQTERIVSSVQSNDQAQNMKWRENRADAKGNQNKLITKYASAAIFAPLIFTIPFPSFNMAMEGQIIQAQLSGGNYIKNIFSFFVIWVMFVMLMSGEWRRHVFILAYTLGYLACLVLSSFAHSSRFHMPIWPMLMLFAAYGIQLAKTNPSVRKWYPMALVIEVVACLGWNWFKLKGRGMI